MVLWHAPGGQNVRHSPMPIRNVRLEPIRRRQPALRLGIRQRRGLRQLQLRRGTAHNVIAQCRIRDNIGHPNARRYQTVVRLQQW